MKHILKRQVLILAAIFLLNVSNAQIAEASKKSGVYTLYRHSFIVKTLSENRTHIATFDSTSSYNNKYFCDFAVSLFMAKQKRFAKYWCEKGYYKK